jgi:HAD superfamily hydrolase (TIGR01549 family)
MSYPPPRGVLLDVDGTLLDSNDAHARAWIDALSEEGFNVEPQHVRDRIGKGGDKLLLELTGLGEASPRGKRIADRRQAIFKERYLADCRPFPEVRPFVERMKREGLRLVVATSASKEELDDLLAAANVSDLLQQKTTSDDAERSKPDPDILEAAIRRAELPRALLVMLGDTPYDVQAARRADMRAIAVRSGGWGENDLKGAVATYADVAELLARYDESPLRA